MSYQRQREEFLVTFGAEFPRADHRAALALLREATGAQRYNEIVCSIDVGPAELARLERRDTARLFRVAEIARAIGAELIAGGDPRGYPFLLRCPSGRTYDFGGRGLGVPGRGLPARCFR